MKLDSLLVLLGFTIVGIAGNILEEIVEDIWEEIVEDIFEDIVDDFVDDIMAMINDEGDDGWTVEYLIQSNGYPVETHDVITSDGYILTLHRIPYGKTNAYNGKVAFLQHGLLSSSADFLLQGSGESLGFLLADAGYDVWMGNARGNTFSRNHTTISYNDDEFWEFSWHEIGMVDIPEMIDYILEQTGVYGLYYVGHSQGTTAYYIMTSSLPQYNDKIIVAAHMSPVAYMSHVASPIFRLLATYEKPIEKFTNLLGVDEFLPNSHLFKYVLGDLCIEDPAAESLCSNYLFLIVGFNRDGMNTSMYPLMSKYSPAGSSTKQVLHYVQEIKSGYFCQYDYGEKENYKRYGQPYPPSYDLSKITAPTYLFWSTNDWLSGEEDVKRLCNEMINGCEEMILVEDENFNHMDYLYGLSAPYFVYYRVIELFNDYY